MSERYYGKETFDKNWPEKELEQQRDELEERKPWRKEVRLAEERRIEEQQRRVNFLRNILIEVAICVVIYGIIKFFFF